MSIVVVKNHKDYIELGADTQETYSDMDMINVEWSKIRKYNDDVYVAAVGNAHLTNIFYAWVEKNPLTTVKTSFDLIEYFKTFYGNVVELLNGIEDLESINNLLVSSQFIIIIENDIWQFNNFYIRKIQAVDEFTAIGSGTTSALSVLNLGESVEKALNMACRTNIYCSNPLNILKIKKTVIDKA